jgi:hypothetical protein
MDWIDLVNVIAGAVDIVKKNLPPTLILFVTPCLIQYRFYLSCKVMVRELCPFPRALAGKPLPVGRLPSFLDCRFAVAHKP